MRKILLVVLLALGIAATAAASVRSATDGILSMPLPRGWRSSVSIGHTPRGIASWILVGNFRFRHARNSKALPSVPRGRALITIGDFPVYKNLGKNWRHAARLRLPHEQRRLISWHVVFRRRALYLSVHFGSGPTAHMRRIVNRRLASVHRVG